MFLRPSIPSFAIVSLLSVLATTQVSDVASHDDAPWDESLWESRRTADPLCRATSSTNVDLRYAAIGGTVTDAAGTPLENVLVSLFKKGFEGGRRQLTPMAFMTVPIGSLAGDACTNREGTFLVTKVPPGEYYVAALARLATLGVTTESRAALEGADLTALLYPGALDIASAQAITVAAGEQRDIDFALRLPQLSTVSGIALNSSGQLVRRGEVVAMPRGEVVPPNYLGANVRRARIEPDGRFTIANLLPGDYSLRANVSYPPPLPLAASPITTVRVNDGDFANLRLTQPSLARVTGRVLFDEPSTSRLPASAIRLVTREWSRDDGWLGIGAMTTPERPLPSLNSDYSFSFPTIPGEITLVLADPSPILRTAWRIKSIRHRGIDMTDRPLQLQENGLDAIEVELTDQFPRVTVRIQNAQTISSTTRALVFAQDRARWRLPFNRYFAVADWLGDGSFSAIVPPGDYHAAAVHTGNGKDWEDPEFLTSLIDRSTIFSAAHGDTVSIVVR